MSKLKDRVTETEARISRTEDIVHPSENMQQQLQQFSAKQDDMEKRLRSCNLRLFGLPEKAEEADSAEFLENPLTTTYGREAFSVMFAVERAHRISTPRHSTAYLYCKNSSNFKDRDKVICLTRERGNIPFWKYSSGCIS